MANENSTLKLNDKQRKTAKPYNPKHARTKTETQIARKQTQIIQHVAEWGKKDQKGGSKISRNLGTVAAATIGGSLVNPYL